MKYVGNTRDGNARLIIARYDAWHRLEKKEKPPFILCTPMANLYGIVVSSVDDSNVPLEDKLKQKYQVWWDYNVKCRIRRASDTA